MRRIAILFLFLAAGCIGVAAAASKPHLVSFGKVMPVKLFVGPAEDKSLDMTVRPLFVDSRLRDFTTGEPHDVTDRLFVVRRAFRVNDRLPEDGKAPRWRWQRGNWLLVDRQTGRISELKLPEFDPFYSAVSWYRDYAAYCGISDSGEKVFAVVAQLGRRKPVLRKEIGAARQGDMPDSECSLPTWQRQPARVTFLPKDRPEITFEVRGHSADVANSSDEE
ncbi:MAG: hypothetical protein LAN37_00440 [Acidobacteriia bacterium]|nr:hypothetical protein [Terriglobia bacterium]